jgi:hypothetical protein
MARSGLETSGLEIMDQQTGRRGWSWWYLLFVIQFVGVLWPPFYNTVEPSWAGIPFYYWYQMAMVIVGAVLTAIVYFATEAD